MDVILSILWLIIALLTIFLASWYFTIPKQLPPGPLGLPIVGSLFSIGKKPYFAFNELSKQYGQIFHIYMGSNLAIVLNNFEAIKEAFVKQAEIFSGRVEDPYHKDGENPNLGLIMNDGEYWKQHRRFILTNLRNNGVGKLTLEPRLLNEIQYFLAELKKNCGKPFNIRILLNCSLANNALLLITGHRYNYDDKLLTRVMHILEIVVSMTQSISIQTFFPWIKYIPGTEGFTKLKERREGIENILNTTADILEDARRLKINDEESYLHAYTVERNKRLQQNKNETIFSEIGLVHNSRDLFTAGAETSSTTLLWTMLYMTHYPNVQKRVQEEIDRAIGREREPSFNDRMLTPFTEATLMEVQRIVSLAPLALYHRNIKETTVLGYSIPKDSMIIPNIYAVHHDPKLWGDPENFRPDRFITEDGKLEKPEYWIPFSIGKRACAGEPLARMEIYLYFVSLMQNFTFVFADGVNQCLEANDSIVRQPVCSIICAISR